MDFQEVCRRIRELRIQGAENVAFAALKGFTSYSSKVQAVSKESFLKALESARSEVFATRPTEPMMRNFINYALDRVKMSKSEKVPELKKLVKDTARLLTESREKDKEAINKFGMGLIREDSNVYTHCHSSTVTNMLKAAHGSKKFTVYSTETRPLFQGRITAKDLAGAGVPVIHAVDSCAAIMLSKCSAMIIGADAISADGSVINKVGSGMFAQIAASKNIPVYVCASSWKYDPETVHHHESIEHRETKEVWANAPENVKILNPAFEVIGKKCITAIVSELGVLWPDDFLRQVKESFYLRRSSSPEEMKR